ncbi:Peptidase S8 and S53 subtilisin kexin sedolisin [Croceitalea dokdonensis DOKDO 023]|uniref:Peptidase S8 and S53 subtilisin kexin sedolisin n=1 Tax=Croceitalea dokdonensis DOKDO 023 TaxID=1300341 RepID=A0A0P7AZP1_9FLAO|nr:S8 family serine peptidase [Croceitalea dokdonensis]KPM31071.1 Peptidase S8 and S53 subtilisin kexin sedolisin [Croceitalea dokdonensis DOKDO 023]
MNCISNTQKYSIFLLILICFGSVLSLKAQTFREKQEIKKNTNQMQLQALIQDFEKEQGQLRSKLIASGMENDWKANQKVLDGTVVAPNGLEPDGTLLYYSTQLSHSGEVTRANQLYSGGSLEAAVTGKGMQIGIWDAGVALETHQEYKGRLQNADQSTLVDPHGTMVTGAILSVGIQPKAQGIAFDANALGHDWTRDKIEVAEAAANGLLVSNHSYGIATDRVPDWYFGSYIKVAQDWDNIMYHAPYYLMVTAAGNAQRSKDNEVPNYGKSVDGFDLLVGFTTAKNGLVVAAADTDIDTSGDLKRAIVSNYSSLGPVDDGRIKPDIAGDGGMVMSTAATGDQNYHSAMGTSMAAPGVSATLLLLQQYHKELHNGYMRAATLKGLALHTADDVASPGPDYNMGWGVINAKQAGEVLKNKDFSSLIREQSIDDGKTLSFKVKANGKEPLSISLSWTDVPGEVVARGAVNNPAPVLVNDLDVRVVKEGETYYPWKLNPMDATKAAVKGDNKVDPYERIDIPEANGEYTVIVSNKGRLAKGTQDFSLIVSGVAVTACTLDAPHNFKLGEANMESLQLQWDGLPETLYEVQVQSIAFDEWQTFYTWDTSYELDALELGERYAAKVRAVCTPNVVSTFTETIHFEFKGDVTEAETYQTYTAEESLRLQVFPNPAMNELYIDSTIAPNSPYQITNTSGGTVAQGMLNGGIEVSNLATGLYTLAIGDGQKLRRAKFIKR